MEHIFSKGGTHTAGLSWDRNYRVPRYKVRVLYVLRIGVSGTAEAVLDGLQRAPLMC